MSNTRVISAEHDTLPQYFSRLWKYRGLVKTFALRDLKIKYAQTFFGVFWILLQPIPSVLIFTFFFAYVIKADTSGIPYPVFALTGIIAWTYFTFLTTGIGNSLIDAQFILKKTFFPKLILPLAKVITGAVDFTAAFVLILIAMPVFSVAPDWKVILFPAFFLLHICVGFTTGIWIASFSFRYRDIQHVVPYVISFSIWLTPVFYPVTILPKQVEMLMYLNPMALVIEGYRFTLLAGPAPSVYYLASIFPVAVLLVAGLWYFKKIEYEIADFI